MRKKREPSVSVLRKREKSQETNLHVLVNGLDARRHLREALLVAGLRLRLGNENGGAGALGVAGLAEEHAGRHVRVRDVLLLAESRQMRADVQRENVTGNQNKALLALADRLGGFR